MSAPARLPDEGGWQRLDRRMLLVHPVRELGRFLPVLVGLLVAGSASGLGGLQLAGVAVPIAYGVLRWVTTTYRVGDGRVELRRGLVSRRVASVALDRVRTVDLTSPVVHRLVGVTILRIGTGAVSGDDALALDGLDAGVAQHLRARLLSARAPAPAPGGTLPDAAPEAPRTVAAFRARWLVYAPFTASGLAVVAAVAAVAGQVVGTRDVVAELDPTRWSVPIPTAAVVTLTVIAVLLLAALVSVVGYAVANGRFRLTRATTSWQVSRGLGTTRETTLDEDRVAGVVLGEPLALRLTGGAHLAAIVTGVDTSERGSAVLVPPAPGGVVRAAAGAVLGGGAPVVGPLAGHGTAATRRRWVRALGPAAGLTVGLLGAAALGGPGWVAALAPLPLLVAAGLAADRARGLGHALDDRHLVSRSGSLVRRREVLAVEHVIGWTLRASWWQRRAGLTTLVATTAGGSGRVTVPDVPERAALGLVRAATPSVVAPFLRVDGPRDAPGSDPAAR